MKANILGHPAPAKFRGGAWKFLFHPNCGPQRVWRGNFFCPECRKAFQAEYLEGKVLEVEHRCLPGPKAQ